MFEMLAYSKETDNKYRWDNNENGIIFSLYIPKWRVPIPKPYSLYVNIYDYEKYNIKINEISHNDIDENPKLANKKITAVVIWNSDHTNTARFDPELNLNIAEIGSPYIPYDLLPNIAIKKLVIEVIWR